MRTANGTTLRRAAVVVGIPGVAIGAIAVLVACSLLLVSIGNGAVLGARDTASSTAATAAGVPDNDLGIYRRAGSAAGVPWQLLAALAKAQRPDGTDAGHGGPFRIRPGTEGITAEGIADLTKSADCIARQLAHALEHHGAAGGVDLLTSRAALGQQRAFDSGENRSAADGSADTSRHRVVAALIELPVENADTPFMTGVYDTALRWALGHEDRACNASADSADLPYALPATHGFTGAEEAIDANGQVPSGKGRGVVTWPQHAALGQPYRDFYITMRWSYADWAWDGTSSAIDQTQFTWFAEKPRLVLVTNPRTGASIVAAALEAGPAPWVGVTNSAATGAGTDHGWPGPVRGTPDGYTGIVSGFPPTALAALGDAIGPARTGYVGQSGDDLTYRWAPDQNATPGPVRGFASATPAPDDCAADKASATNGSAVRSDGVAVTIPAGPTVDPAAAGQSITAPTEAIARGLAAGLGTVGLPYVWGGGTDGGGPDNGCSRGGGQKNSCGSTVGLDCSGLTGWTLANAGFRIPTNSTSQRDGGTDIPRQDGLPGDIIGYPGHVAVYLGRIGGVDYLLEAPDVGLQVRVRPVNWSGADPFLHRFWA